ncbi:heterogeneous nuclear ribonucleoprotein R-like [Agrilus planipennis]|uniref:Heterogeneous nuclear ribonucleoprotein R-like n=1 Tax=Agrilus planipennis TaxID=224129 RepID=A0A1W4XSA9_AGRPL|nr:heterogeneous nuclear ribonucleoprotein R-like [Agrilus planipennis]
MGSKYTPNRRLFFGSIPMNKTRDDIWKALLREGVQNIVDVISYKSYSDRHVNRGYVFVEFTSDQEAERAHAKHRNNLKLFGKKVIIDWSNPMIEPEASEMKSVKKLFVRNLPVTMTRQELVQILTAALPTSHSMIKVYKFKDYSFLHFDNRKNAEKALEVLKSYFEGLDFFKDDIQVTWAKPPSRFRTRGSLNSTKSIAPSNCYCHLQSSADSPSLSSRLSTDFSQNYRRRFSTSSDNSFRSANSSSSSGVDFSFDNKPIASPNLVTNYSNTKQQVSLREEYPLLQNEPEWVLDFLLNTLKVALKDKTLHELMDELDIDYFDNISS